MFQLFDTLEIHKTLFPNFKTNISTKFISPNFILKFLIYILNQPKLFILKEFYFLILESNVGPHNKYSSK